jgi:hypothetical protein
MSGIEPESGASETLILSIVLHGQNWCGKVIFYQAYFLTEPYILKAKKTTGNGCLFVARTGIEPVIPP